MRAECASERVLELTGGMKSIARIVRCRAFDNLHHALRKLRTQIAQSRPCAARVRLFQLGEGSGLDRTPSRQQIEKEHAKAVDVARNTGRAAFEKLRRHVGGSAGKVRRHLARLRRPRAAEIHEHDTAADLPHHVLRLDVAMEKRGGLQRRERPAQIDADPNDFARAHRAALVHHVGERLSLDVLHPDSDLLVDLLDAVYRDDVGVMDPGEVARLAVGRAARRRRSGAQLERDFTIELRVPGAIDIAKGAAPDALEENQMMPVARRRFSRQFRTRVGLVRAPMALNDSLEALQVLDDVPRLVVSRAAIDGVPIDSPAVGHIRPESDQPGIVMPFAQHPSPRRAAAERG